MITQAILQSFRFTELGVQQIGVGVAAFLITCATVFMFLFARHDRIGRLVFNVFIGLFIWGWVAFLYGVTDLPWLARDFRLMAFFGAVIIAIATVFFAVAFLEEVRPLTRTERWFSVMSIVLHLMMVPAGISDVFLGTQFLVGTVDISPRIDLSPHAGSILWLFIAVQSVVYVFCSVLFARRARRARDAADRRRANILFVGAALGFAFVSMRWLPWYGVNELSFIGILGAPTFVISLFYAIKRYGLFNIELASAELLVIVLWTFTFFRTILEPSLSAAIPDIFLLIIVIILGLFLIHLVLKELQERHEVERISADLRHLNEHLEQQVIERTNALVREKTQFITVAAHQLRTPIAGLRWTFEFLAHQDAVHADQTQFSIVQKGARAATNMARIVNDLLNVAQMSAGKFTFAFSESKICDILTDAVSTFEVVAREHTLSLTATCAPETMTALVDAHKLRMAIENCIDNAVKYTLPGGAVHVSAAPSGASHIHITIADTGVGMTDEERTHIFDQFFRSKRATQLFTDGSGIGLSIVKTIVEGHRGTVDVTSQEGQGTTIVINIPTSNTALPNRTV